MCLCMVTPKALIDLPFYFPISTQRHPSNLLCMRWTARRASSPILPSFTNPHFPCAVSRSLCLSQCVTFPSPALATHYSTRPPSSRRKKQAITQASSKTRCTALYIPERLIYINEASPSLELLTCWRTGYSVIYSNMRKLHEL